LKCADPYCNNELKELGDESEDKYYSREVEGKGKVCTKCYSLEWY